MSRQESNFNHCTAHLSAKLIQSQKKKSKKQRKKQLESTEETNGTEDKATMVQPAKMTNCTVSKQMQTSDLKNDVAEVQIPSQQEKKKLKKLRQKEKKLAAKESATLNGECSATTSSAASSNGNSCTRTASLGKSTGAIPKEKPKRPVVQEHKSEILLSKQQQKKLQRLEEEQMDKNLNQAKTYEINIAKMPINTKEKDTGEKSKNLQNSNPMSKKKRRQKQKQEQELEREHFEVQKTLSFQRPSAQPKTFAMHKPPRKSTLLKPLVFDVTTGETLTWAQEFQQLVRSELHCNAQTAPFYKIGRHFGMHATRTDDAVIKELFEKFLVEKKAGHFTYTPKEELRVLLVLKRPPTLEQCSAKDVKDALQHIGVPLLRVEDFKSMWKPDHSYGRYLVEVSRDVDLETLYNQTNLLEHDNWKWSKLKKPAISQCRNCQRYGHVANNCRMPFRCVKCKEPHDPGKCPRSWIIAGVKNVYCHNCKNNGHPSNYRGCPAYKQRCEALERQRANSNFSALIKKVVHSVNKALQKNKVLLTQRN